MRNPVDPNSPYDPRQLPDLPGGNPVAPRQNTGVGMVHYIEPRSVDEALGLQDLFRIIRRQWWVVGGAAIISVALSLFTSLHYFSYL